MSRLTPMFFLFCCLAPACGGDSKADRDASAETVEGEEARRAVVAALGEQVILASYRAFSADAATLAATAEALAAAEATSSEPAPAATLQATRDAWSRAIDTWQEAELFQVGPAGPSATVAGGRSMRAPIYSWPLNNPCRVDQETVAQALLDPAKLAAAPANVRGLAALEYLLFDPDSDNACPASSTINSDGSWAALGDEEVRRRRTTYAAAVARDLGASAEALRLAWEPAGDDFLGELVGAGTRATYDSVQDALNAISDALFYLDKETKDMKLAGPLGIIGCAAESCPELVESRFAGRSLAHIRHNIIGFQRAFHGGEPDGLGFDDLLVAAGAGALAGQVADQIAAARSLAEAIADPLEQAIADDRDQVEALYASLSGLNQLMKTQLLGVLDLELPERVEGDND